jgi:hypothetical protein
MKQIHLLGLPCFGMVSPLNAEQLEQIEQFARALNWKPFLPIYVDYDGKGNIHFNPDGTNAHQLEALRKFVEQKQESATIRVPHALGGDFVAKFELVPRPIYISNHITQIKYTNDRGQDVKFFAIGE